MQKTKITGIILLLCVATSIFAQSADEPKTEKQSLVEQVTSWYMDNMNYGTVTLLMTIESSFIPFPSEIIVPPAAYKASQENSGMNIILVVVFATIGALLGSLFNYYLALWVGRPVIHKFADSKLGRMCLLSAEKVQKAEDYFVKHGNISTFIGRLLPGIRQLISLPAGLARMSLLSFMTYTVLGAGIWNIVLAVLGYIAHGQASLINQYSKEISYVMLLLCGLFLLYLLYVGFIKKNRKP
jgi:membrane protein DedA with SNARE-associated domain